MSEEYVPMEFDDNKIVAAILAAAWFMRMGLESGASNREQLVREYWKMVDIVENNAC